MIRKVQFAGHWAKTFGVVLALMTLSACVSMDEKHYFFASIDPETKEISNAFRLSVRGGAGFTNARYLAGNYDERAVDLFFNEIKASNLDQTSLQPGAPRFFDTTCDLADAASCEALKAKRLVTVPVGDRADQNGVFVLLLSTNADAIASTIGQFAESDANISAMTFLATRETRIQAAVTTATQSMVKADRAATFEQLGGLYTALPAAGVTGMKSEREKAYLAILRATAAGLNPEAAPSFTTMGEARVWFAAQPRTSKP